VTSKLVAAGRFVARVVVMLSLDVVSRLFALNLYCGLYVTVLVANLYSVLV
jgi:hypothetical protein